MSWSRPISSHFGAIHLKCVLQPKIAKKSLNPFLRVSDHSRSSTSTPLKNSSLVLVIIANMSVLICNRFTLDEPIAEKRLLGGTPLSRFHLRETFSHSCIIFCRKIPDTLKYYTVKTWSLYLSWAWIGTASWQTDRRTDRITTANTRVKTKYILLFTTQVVQIKWQTNRQAGRCTDVLQTKPTVNNLGSLYYQTVRNSRWRTRVR